MSDLRPMPGPGSAFLPQPTKFQMPQVDVPTIKHNAPSDICDGEDENLMRLLNTERCARCTKMFAESENIDGACQYHPGPTQTALRTQNHLDRITFLCCGSVQIGFDPILHAAPPCKFGRHISNDDKQQQIEAARGFRAAAAAGPAPVPSKAAAAPPRGGPTPKPPSSVRPASGGRRIPPTTAAAPK